jgi:hypothetical protein
MSAFGEKFTCWKTGTNSGGLCASFVFGNTNKGRNQIDVKGHWPQPGFNPYVWVMVRVSRTKAGSVFYR